MVLDEEFGDMDVGEEIAGLSCGGQGGVFGEGGVFDDSAPSAAPLSPAKGDAAAAASVSPGEGRSPAKSKSAKSKKKKHRR